MLLRMYHVISCDEELQARARVTSCDGVRLGVAGMGWGAERYKVE